MVKTCIPVRQYGTVLKSKKVIFNVSYRNSNNASGFHEFLRFAHLIFDELLLLPLHHPLEMVQLLLMVYQHLVALQEEQVLIQQSPIPFYFVFLFPLIRQFTQ
jgi:hypothetical protein